MAGPDRAVALQLRELTARMLRNLVSAELELAPGRSLIVGDNGQGKTTLLEGAYLLGALRSFRGSRAVELIQHGAERAQVGGRLGGPEPPARVEVSLDRAAGREVRVDGKQPELASHFHRFPMVAFHPGDLGLVLGSPGDRRRFLDRALFQAEPAYASWHRDYRHGLRSRNELLRRRAAPAEIRAFDGVLAGLGAAIGRARARLGAALSEATAEVLDELGVAAFDVRLSARVEPDEQALAAALEAALPADRIRGRTGVGPHTDDLVLERREGRARQVASRGEARALAVSLRLAERRVLTRRTGSVPVLLLDDVAAELDRQRTAGVVSTVTAEGGQVVVTATGGAEERFGGGWRRFLVQGGAVVEVTET